LREYRYRLSDPDQIEGKIMDVISFQPRKRIIGKNQIRGYIWVDQETKAIA